MPAEQTDPVAPVLRCEGLSLEVQLRGGRRKQALQILEDVNIDLAPHELACVLGPSGCGKSTILNAVAGFGLPGKLNGRVTIGGEPRLPYHPGLGYMVQHDTLLPWRTVRQNVALALRLRADADGRGLQGSVREALEAVGLGGFENVYPHQLSGGMRKRAQLAQALAQNPSILLMDEPFGALDFFTKLEMHQVFLRRWEEASSAVLFVTHDLQEAIMLADRIVVLKSRPATVIADVKVPFPRPRDHRALVGEPAYREIYESLWNDLSLDGSGPFGSVVEERTGQVDAPPAIPKARDALSRRRS